MILLHFVNHHNFLSCFNNDTILLSSTL